MRRCPDPSGIFLPGTELLQSPFRTEFSMGSRSQRYRRSLQCHRWFLRSYRLFLRSYRRSLWRCRDPWGVVAIPEAIGGSAVIDAATPIVAQLVKHHKTLLNIVKHHETCKTLWHVVKHRESLVKHHETLLKHCGTSWNTRALVIRCDDNGARCGDICICGSDVGDRVEVIRCDDIGARCGDVTATSAIARNYQRYRRGVSGDICDCGVGITRQMCNRVTNHGDMSTFSKPVPRRSDPVPRPSSGARGVYQLPSSLFIPSIMILANIVAYNFLSLTSHIHILSFL